MFLKVATSLHSIRSLDIAINEGRQTQEELNETYGEDAALFIPCDVTSNVDFQRAFTETKAKYGRVDILVNNAGVGNERDWLNTINVNLTGTIRGTMLAFDHLGESDDEEKGVIINVASNLGLYPLNLLPTYSATKEGVVTFTLAWADPSNVQKTRVKLNAICPGPVGGTEFFKLSYTSEGSFHPALLADQVKKANPMEPSVVAAGVIKLLEEDKNGALLYVTHKGYEYVKFPEPI